MALEQRWKRIVHVRIASSSEAKQGAGISPEDHQQKAMKYVLRPANNHLYKRVEEVYSKYLETEILSYIDNSRYLHQYLK